MWGAILIMCIAILIVNCLGGYFLGIFCLHFWQYTDGLERISDKSVFVKIMCTLLWPLALAGLRLDIAKEEKDWQRADDLPIKGLGSKAYLGIMVLIGFFPKLLEMGTVGVFLLMVKFAIWGANLLGGLLKPGWINGNFYQE
jgi:hypothetical protein